jgi:hypothetical protein
MGTFADSNPRPAFAHLLLRVGLSAFVLSLGWEWGHLPAYGCPASGLTVTLTLLMPAAGADVAMTFMLGLFALTVQRWPAYPLGLTRRRALAFVVGGAGLAIVVELVALAAGIWSYSPLMPLVPGLQVGWSPVLHGMTVPLLSVFLARPARPSLVSQRGETLSNGPRGGAAVAGTALARLRLRIR